MIKSIIAKIKAVMYKMNILKGAKSVNAVKNIDIDEEHYKRIELWKHLYKGYCEDIHKIHYHTLEGRKTRRMLTLNMPKIASEELAKLVFNEKCDININNETFKENVEEVLKNNRFDKEFQGYIEKGFAMGGFVIKGYVENDELRLTFVTADCFLPTSWRNGKVIAGTFINQSKKGKHYYTLLERHDWEQGNYVIVNELYKSESINEVGIKVSLSELYPELEEVVTITTLKQPLFVYFKPNIANNFDVHSPLGISIYANSIDTIKSIDTAFDSFNREFRLGKKRILVPASAVKTVVDPATGDMRRYFDANDEAYQAFNFEDNNEIKDVSVEIRVEEHISAIQTLLDIFAMQVGFSAGTFSFEGQSVKTATEIISEQSKTFRTLASHEIIVEEGLKELVALIGSLAELYNLFSMPADYEVNVDFDDSIIQDRDADLDYYLKMKNGGLISALTALMELRSLTEEEARAELERIREEQATNLPDINDMFGDE